jgi:hypothetical protein
MCSLILPAGPVCHHLAARDRATDRARVFGVLILASFRRAVSLAIIVDGAHAMPAD